MSKNHPERPSFQPDNPTCHRGEGVAIPGHLEIPCVSLICRVNIGKLIGTRGVRTVPPAERRIGRAVHSRRQPAASRRAGAGAGAARGAVAVKASDHSRCRFEGASCTSASVGASSGQHQKTMNMFRVLLLWAMAATTLGDMDSDLNPSNVPGTTSINNPDYTGT